MRPPKALHKQIWSIFGPALGVVLAYSFTFYSPLQRTLKVERTKLHKMEIAGARRASPQLIAEKLAKAESEIRSLNEQINAGNQMGSHLVSRRADLRSEFLQSRSPAMTMAETLSLLSQHRLQCVNSSPVADEAKGQRSPLTESLKPVAALLRDATTDTSTSAIDSLDRREMRITLRGRFQDIQSALREIQAAPLGIFTVSLEMEDSDAHTDIRIWILTIAV